ncbi:flagellar basal body-associated FliL family protein [Desulfatibacillum aliphaticivorans]|uniref:Flagellar protein FliL n=1 Tax=Desulfatibacillum aliphaticivorans TaxID=218208 RepID=B8FK39_DESAL|nr:flagellar basal body-associated FliL family protein [Desulfatibacillum aliphaticivorans]ACL02714.1 Flagellar basal body-associated protein FliL [Desulfatibacillum aliphaticivorans]
MADDAQAEGKGGGGLKWILIALIVVVLGAGGFIGFLLMSGGGDAQPAANVPAAPAPAPAGNPNAGAPGIMVEMDSFIVNLRDREGKRYLKAKINFEVPTEAVKAEFTTRKAQIRDVILILLSAKSFAEISRLEGKLQLKEELMARVNQVLSSGRVSNVFFTEFVVQ